MSIKTVKRVAAKIMKVGENKVRIKPGYESRIAETLTREDVRELIKEKIVYKTSIKGVSRARAKKRAEQKRKGRRKGPGKKKGKHKGINKKMWMNRIRAQRKILNEFRDKMDSYDRGRIYYRIKGGLFKSKIALMNYLKEHNIIKKE
ncbi:50S ribosomal protein L19e [Candidatus Micrarchaeota archaeon]|nr:50S ribosomal protein L19e [Candidatus Micrarchaeota archaeon]